MVQTNNLDLEIKNIDDVIFENIERDIDYDRGFMSQNILTRLRNLIEHVALKILSNVKGMELEITYENIDESIKYIRTVSKYKFLTKFHRFVQNSVGHLTPTNENAERLMLKYYEYLIKLKDFYKTNYGIDILNNITKFPLNTDKTYYEYYGEIAEKIENIPLVKDRKYIEGRYYIQKVKPFFINRKIYYEVTLSPAIGNISKFDRITMFTKCEIETNCSIKVSIVKTKVKIFGAYTNIQIINNWEISIRPCEISNMYKIFGENIEFSANYKEYREIMPFLTSMGYNLLDLVDMARIKYEKIKEHFEEISRTNYIFGLIDKCREICRNNKDGKNIVRYLLYKCNNVIIKKQYMKDKNPKLSNLNLKYGCIPFEEMPFVTSLIGHNPKGYDLLECFDIDNRKDEILARYIQLNSEQNGCLYTTKSEVDFLGNIEDLVQEYNSKIYYPKHENRKLIIEGNNIYIKGYEENTKNILKELIELSKEGIRGYKNSVKFWMSEENYTIDDSIKKEILENLFENSKVAIIYGAAGTGKSTMIKHISNFYNSDRKIYLANTHPAIENLRRKVKAQNCEFYTIKKILSNNCVNNECDILIIDECSTVSNEDMINILLKVKFELLVLVGDIYQIESITFGNWFNIAKMIIDNKAKYELLNPYRSNNENLKKLWDRVRNIEDDITEWIVKNRYAQTLDLDILTPNDSDEIILCLNYDGLYGINNINRFMQNSNKNDAVDWGIGTYKVGDPILFSESNRFSPIIYNNLKGKIVDIRLEEYRIWFDIEIDMVINEKDAYMAGLELLENSETKSVVRFFVNQYKDLDEDDDLNSTAVVPFVVAYAVSIHKSQGLEYNSVKVIITQEIEEMISHNIFYTSITRAIDKLKIYWTPECQERVIKNLKFKFNAKDASIIKNKLLKE